MLEKQEISSFWHSRKGYKGIGIMEILCIKSWLDNGYRFCLYTYDLDDKMFNKFSELNSDFVIKDANSIIPYSELFFDDRGAGMAAFSDYFRFNMIAMGGGFG